MVLSQWTGRIDGLVFKVVNGKQVIMPYKADDALRGRELPVRPLAVSDYGRPRLRV